VFYVRTAGTSSVMTCYDAVSGFKSNVNQVGFFKEGELVVRKVKDLDNGMSCLVAYISTPGTAPRSTATRAPHRAAGPSSAAATSAKGTSRYTGWPIPTAARPAWLPMSALGGRLPP
jgi:hypothetical protein